jgi:type II secretory pathway pseudopilin PulG
MNKKINKEEGYSLIEALVALGILLLGIVPVVTVATQAIFFHYRAGEVEEAARLSQTMIDYIKSRGYDELNLMVEDNPFEKKYNLSLVTSSSAFTVDNFGDISDFNISQDMILLSSKGINLSQVNFYVMMDKVHGDLKKSDKSNDSYPDPVTGETVDTVYKDGIIYGRFIFGIGNLDSDKKTGRRKELETTFIITPIENWK